MTARRTGLRVLAAAGLSTVLAVGLLSPGAAAAVTTASPAAPKPSPAKSSSPGGSPRKIYRKSLAVAAAAKSVRVRARIAQGGDTLKVDAVLTGRKGTARIRTDDGGSVTIVRRGTTLYLSGDQRFWQAAGSDDITTEQAAALAGKWVEVKGDDPDLRELRDFTTLGFWVDDISGFRPFTRVRGRGIAGVKTVGLFEPGRDGGVFHVATKGRPYPVLVESHDRAVSIHFSKWNRRMPVRVPGADLEIAF